MGKLFWATKVLSSRLSGPPWQLDPPTSQFLQTMRPKHHLHRFNRPYSDGERQYVLLGVWREEVWSSRTWWKSLPTISSAFEPEHPVREPRCTRHSSCLCCHWDRGTLLMGSRRFRLTRVGKFSDQNFHSDLCWKIKAFENQPEANCLWANLHLCSYSIWISIRFWYPQ